MLAHPIATEHRKMPSYVLWGLRRLSSWEEVNAVSAEPFSLEMLVQRRSSRSWKLRGRSRAAGTVDSHDTQGVGAVSFKMYPLDKVLQLLCDVESEYKLIDNLAGDDYVPRLKKRIESIHDRVRGNTLGACDQKKQRYVLRTENTVTWLDTLCGCITQETSWSLIQTSGSMEWNCHIQKHDLGYRIRKPPNWIPHQTNGTL